MVKICDVFSRIGLFFPSGQNYDLPDGRPLRLAHQNHFGSQCAIGSVYWHLPAKVGLKKPHFGKPSLTECTLRHPPCQSELAEAHRVICGTSASLQIHPEDTMYVKIGQVDLRKHIQLGNSASMSSRHHTLVHQATLYKVNLCKLKKDTPDESGVSIFHVL